MISEGLAVLPVLGSVIFLILSSLALIFDVQLQKKELPNARRHYPRAWSKSAANPQRSPHWFLLAAAVVYGPTIGATALWQQEAAVKSDTIAIVLAILFHYGDIPKL